jgi:transcriptional regulator with XRE-family HTH domain
VRAVNGYRGRGMFGDRGNPPSQGGPTALGDLLKRRRLALGFSRTRVGELSQINASTIEAWETGRVAKPPIHDVMRLARALSISTADLERAVMEEPARPAAESRAVPQTDAVPLLERAIALLGWSEDDAAGALNTTAERIRGLRHGQGELSVLEVMSLIAVLAAFPSGAGGSSEQEVATLLAQLRRVKP